MTLPDPEMLAKDVGDAAAELADSMRGDAEMRAAWVRNLQALARCLRDPALIVPLEQWEGQSNG